MAWELWPAERLLRLDHVYQASLHNLMHVSNFMQERSYGLGATCCARMQVYHASVHYKRRLVGALIRLMKQQKRRLRVGQLFGRMHSGVEAPFWCLGSVCSLQEQQQRPLENEPANVKYALGCAPFVAVSGLKEILM